MRRIITAKAPSVTGDGRIGGGYFYPLCRYFPWRGGTAPLLNCKSTICFLFNKIYFYYNMYACVHNFFKTNHINGLQFHYFLNFSRRYRCGGLTLPLFFIGEFNELSELG